MPCCSHRTHHTVVVGAERGTVDVHGVPDERLCRRKATTGMYGGWLLSARSMCAYDLTTECATCEAKRAAGKKETPSHPSTRSPQTTTTTPADGAVPGFGLRTKAHARTMIGLGWLACHMQAVRSYDELTKVGS